MKRYILLLILSLLFPKSSFSQNTIPILTYHSFSPPGTVKNKFRINISPKMFKEQLRYLSSQQYKVISLEEFVEALNKKLPLPSKVVILTIDDGDFTIFKYAFPILKSFNFKATLFLTTNFVNEEFSWEKLKIMEDSNIIDVQCHTMTHHYRSLVRDFKQERKVDYLKRLEEELLTSKLIIEKKLNKKVKYLAYPYGKFDRMVIKKAKEYGYKALLSFHGGVNTLNSDPFNLNRLPVYRDYTLDKFISLLNIKPLKVYYLSPPLASYTFYKRPKIFAMIENPVDLKIYQIIFTLDEKIYPYVYEPKYGKCKLLYNKDLIQGVHFLKIQLLNRETKKVEKEVGWIFTRQGVPFITVKGVKLFLKIFLTLFILILLTLIFIKVKDKYVIRKYRT